MRGLPVTFQWIGGTQQKGRFGGDTIAFRSLVARSSETVEDPIVSSVRCPSVEMGS